MFFALFFHMRSLVFFILIFNLNAAQGVSCRSLFPSEKNIEQPRLFEYAPASVETTILSLFPELPHLSMIADVRPSNLSEKEVRALQRYTGDSDKFNPSLRRGIKPRKGSMAQSLINALEKFPKYEGIVFRDAYNGYHPNSGDVRSQLLIVGNTFKDLGFLSTDRIFRRIHISESPRITPPTQMVIRSRTGRSIRRFSGFNSREDEVLFLPGTMFEVIFVQPGKHGSHTVYLDEIIDQ